MSNIILPGNQEENSKPKLVSSKETIPLSIWQSITNKLFYNGHARPLEILDTLGRADPLLPKAYVNEMLTSDDCPDSLHEIGPGNFHMATSILKEIRRSTSRNFDYHCYDRYDSSYESYKAKVESTNKLQFRNAGIQQVPRFVPSEEKTRLLLVELLDDTDTEHAAHYNGEDYLMSVRMHLPETCVMENRSLAASILARRGNFTDARVLMRNDSMAEHVYSAHEIIGLIDAVDQEGLQDVHPAFLEQLQYSNEGDLCDLEEITRYRFQNCESESREYIESVVSFFRDQLRSLRNGQFASFPVAGLRLLWDLQDRDTTRVDIFDYGYTTTDLQRRTANLSYNVFAGQVTSSVNFDVLNFAAERLGYTTHLQGLREYITEQTGHETITLGRLLWNILQVSKKQIDRKTLVRLIRVFSADKVLGFDEHERISVEQLPLSLRITLSNAQDFLQELRTNSSIDGNVDLSEFKYYLSCSKKRK